MSGAVRLGIRENGAQFALLVLVNAFVGAMVGLERSILPVLAEQEFGVAARTAILSFVFAFGLAKAAANYFAGRLAERHGRKPVLVAGWLVAVPVPFLLIAAPDWNWIVVANVFLGASQGLTWLTAVIMKVDLAGPRQRGLATGLNECAGYVAVAASAWATGWIAASYGLRPEPFYLGFVYVAAGLGLSVAAVRETRGHAVFEAQSAGETALPPAPREIFLRTTITDRNLSSATQAGFVNNLNDGMAWGLFPLWFAASQMSLTQIGTMAAAYPATWGIAQLATGAWSDRVGRKRLIVAGMWVQAAGILIVLCRPGVAGALAGSVLLGIGTAMVYPTLLALIGDVTEPGWRAPAMGVYRLWRDLGYAAGALLSGVIADAFGLASAILVGAVLTFVSGAVAALRMSETLKRP